jgi:hypothetical protein
MQALDVRGMAKADIGNNCCNGPGSADLFVQSDRPARETAAEPASQFLASVWTIRNEKDRAVAGHSCRARAGGLQLEKGSNSTMGGDLPIFSEAWRPISASRRTDTSDMVPLGLADWASSCPLLDELFTPRHNSAPSGPGLAVIRANYLFMRLLENYTRPRVLHACPLIEERANVATSITAQE